MSEEVYTVEQFAERLKLHPKTVLRFIREGRVRAVKVGKSYRILRSEMEALTGAAPGAEPTAFRVTSTRPTGSFGLGRNGERLRASTRAGGVLCVATTLKVSLSRW